MLIYLGIIIILIIVLVFFIYFIWKDEEQIQNLEKLNNLNINNVSIQETNGYIHKSSINIDNFKIGLQNINFKIDKLKLFKQEIHQRIIGLDEFINAIIITLLAKGHLLVEGVPGLAKTKTIETMAQLLDLDFTRIQFTPDMLPADIIGIEIFNKFKNNFEIKTGPVYTNIVLADEINRTTPKVQSALLEAMQEKKLSLGGKDILLPNPFLVLATQNPIEQEGTYVLPEAQIDRFLFKILVDYPNLSEEIAILNVLETEKDTKIQPILNLKEILAMQAEIRNITVSNHIKDYIARLITKTRLKHPHLFFGSSPRGSIGLLFGAKALAFLEDRDYVMHEDIQRLVLPTCRHRILLNYESKSQDITADEILLELFTKVTLE